MVSEKVFGFTGIKKGISKELKTTEPKTSTLHWVCFPDLAPKLYWCPKMTNEPPTNGPCTR